MSVLAGSLLMKIPKFSKRIFLVLIDICCCFISTWFAFYLRIGEFLSLATELSPALVSMAVSLPVFAVFGLYTSVFRYGGIAIVRAVVVSLCIYSLVYMTIFLVVGVDGVPRTIGLIQPVLFFCFVLGSRLVPALLFSNVVKNPKKIDGRAPALIYGAGRSEFQIAEACSSSEDLRIIGFINELEDMRGRKLNGIPVFGIEDLDHVIHSEKVTHILLSNDGLSKSQKINIVSRLSKYSLAVRTLPSINDLAMGKVAFNDLEELDVDILLNRQVVAADTTLLEMNISDQVVLVSGAGGSIGRQLCRQILEFRPRVLLLLEQSEYALYEIHEELMRAQLDDEIKVPVTPILGSVQDENFLRTVFQKWRPHSVYHTAAYKHVPLVESNVIEGIKNNVFGTFLIAQSAGCYGVDNFILISTDKAVRPTNIMGATKRLAEMILQAMDASKSFSATKFSMVRFGNVIASSGSVIPKFRRQIRDGGPLTLTHPEVTRFFMTIPEAAQLVIQAGALSKGGDVFILDMGDPIKIADLAEKMVTLSGLKLKSEGNPNGDISIKYIGLRPGEKLHEELLIEDNARDTAHPKIFTAKESFTEWEHLCPQLEALREASTVGNLEQSIKLLTEIVTQQEHR